MINRAILFSTLFLLSIITHSQEGKGSLLIAGGGLIPGNKNAYNQLLELAGGAEKASFAIVPAASGVPVKSYAFVRDILISYGVKEENIYLVPVAVMDDDSTSDTDESQWIDNASNLQIADKIRNCTGVWFTGGDQTRITRALYMPDGSRSPVLQAAWDVYERGGVIGGTSAGAAIMSEVMIGNGTSLGALQQPIISDNGDENQETNALLLTRGLGFFPEGIVDQHFNARARLGRLVVALMTSKDKNTLAFGVDENTALLYSAAERTIRVAGKGGVTIIDASEATINRKGGLPEISNLSVSFIEEGDTFFVSSQTIIPGPGKTETRGNEYYHRENPAQGGILSPNSSTFLDLITYNLIDNEAAQMVSNISFADNDIGFRFTFSKKIESQGYYLEDENEQDHYTICDIRLDISPVRVVITEIE